MSSRLDKFWHKTLGRPYRLSRAFDLGGGDPVVLLHGIGRMGLTWKPLVQELAPVPCRVVAFDLLGFGDSPKPTWPKYGVDSHADAVIAAIKRMRAKKPVILVGHSMGCLIAVRVARRRPDLVRHLVLYEMPLYAGLPDTRLYKLRLNFYLGLYKRMSEFKPAATRERRQVRQKVVEAIMGFYITNASWKPFVRSLKHTIMEQTTHIDIKKLKMPMDVIYGSKDRLVIRGETKLIFGEDVKHVNAHIIKERHRITVKAGKFLAHRIQSALDNKTNQEIKKQEPLR